MTGPYVESIRRNVLEIATQAELDGLRCVERVEGDLSIEGDEIEDLGALANLREVTGTLGVRNSSALASLDGLSTLQSVSGLGIEALPALTRLGDLSSLATIEDSLLVSNLPLLTTLTGLPEALESPTTTIRLEQLGVTSLTGLPSIGPGHRVEIVACRALTSLEGMNSVDGEIGSLRLDNVDALVSLEGMEDVESLFTLDVLDNDALRSLTGLDGLATTESTIDVRDNPALQDLNALANLLHVGGALRLVRNGVLGDLDGLLVLEQVDDELRVCGNAHLDSLGMPTLTNASGTLTVIWNDALPQAEVERISTQAMPPATKSGGNRDGAPLPIPECPWLEDDVCDAVSGLIGGEEQTCDDPPCCDDVGPLGLCAEGTDDPDCQKTGVPG